MGSNFSFPTQDRRAEWLRGGGFSKISQSHYGCSTARNKGTCDNLLAVRRDKLEATVLEGLKDQLMHPELVTAFIEESTGR
jgi:hypothetical protein